jgi:hypothetical protein
MSISDPVVMPLARELLECYEQELAKLANPPASVGLRPGSVVDLLMSTTDDECCAGLAWVRPASFNPSNGPFPTQPQAATKQGPLAWAVNLELGYARCAPTPDANSIPTNEQWDEVTQGVMDAGAAMRRAVCCWIQRHKPMGAQQALVGQSSWISVEGGCTGLVLPVSLQGPACDCRDAGPHLILISS